MYCADYYMKVYDEVHAMHNKPNQNWQWPRP
jgi:hypothetical protein